MRTETRARGWVGPTREEPPLLPKSKQNKGGSARRRAREARAPGAGAGWLVRRERTRRPRRSDKSRRPSVPASHLLEPGQRRQRPGRWPSATHSRTEPAPTPCAPGPGPSRVTSELRRPRSRTASRRCRGPPIADSRHRCPPGRAPSSELTLHHTEAIRKKKPCDYQQRFQSLTRILA